MSMTDQEKIDVIQAQMDGKRIQSRRRGDSTDQFDTQASRQAFNFFAFDYRVEEIVYVEITVADAFRLLARSPDGVDCQFTDDTSDFHAATDHLMSGARNGDRPFLGLTAWERCRVTQEVYSA